MSENQNNFGIGLDDIKKSVICDSCTIIGDIITDNGLVISGKVTGNITSSEEISLFGTVIGDISGKDIILGSTQLRGSILKSESVSLLYPDSMIEGSISTNNCDSHGHIKGNIIVSDTLSLGSTASVIGDVSAGSISIEKGAVLHGRMTIDQK